jgi:hypothetical protein
VVVRPDIAFTFACALPDHLDVEKPNTPRL